MGIGKYFRVWDVVGNWIGWTYFPEYGDGIFAVRVWLVKKRYG